MDFLNSLDISLFEFLNGCHSDFFDPIMIFASKIWVWVPLYLAVAVALFIKLGWKRALVALIALILCFALCDQISVLIKDSVERLRPCNNPHVAARVLEKRHGLYGFVSSHAANTFGFALLSALIFRFKPYSWLILFWAGVVSYSRIYVGKHFPGDIICGALLGLAIAFFIFQIYRFVNRRIVS